MCSSFLGQTWLLGKGLEYAIQKELHSSRRVGFRGQCAGELGVPFGGW